MKDLIIGAFNTYVWDQVKVWANSIDACGFTGDKAVIIYNSNKETLQKLEERNFKVQTFDKDSSGNPVYSQLVHIYRDRFFHASQFLEKLMKSETYRYVIMTDVKDVLFQSNPSDWLSENLGDYKILASCEGLRYQHEYWGNQNLSEAFPLLHDKLKDNPVWNCGVIAGDPAYLRDLFINMFHLSIVREVADQAAFNVLLSLEPYKSITKFSMGEEGWACHAGTTVDLVKINLFRPNLLDPEPKWDGTYITTNAGKRFVIFHMYDRVSLASLMQHKYV